MKTPKKAIVSRKVSEQQIMDAKRWEAFIVASGTPFENLSNEWLSFFDEQSNIDTASSELVRLIDLAMLADTKKEEQK